MGHTGNVMTSSRDDRIGLFRNLQSPATQPQSSS
jgi:hypothetical protein